MSITQDIIARSADIYDARLALIEEIEMRDLYNMEDGPDFAELVEARTVISKEIAEREYAILHSDDFEPDYEDILSRRGYRYE
jgi:hypothetical protein